MLLGFLLWNSSTLFAQEICDNGIDDDGDSLIDEYDPDCCNHPTLTAFYDPCTTSNCFFRGDTSSITLDQSRTSPESDYRTVGGIPVFGDLDGDGTIEIVVDRFNVTSNAIDILDGNTLAVEETINISTHGDNRGGSIAIGDILDANGNNGSDGIAEIIVSLSDGQVDILHKSSLAGSYTVHQTVNNVLLSNAPAGWITYAMNPNLADFDQDGITEIYCGYFIIDAATGTIMNPTPPSNGLGAVSESNQAERTSYTVAADVLPAYAGLELVAGNTVYEVTINRSGASPTATLMTRTQAPNNRKDGWTSVADWDNDGDLDGIIATINGTNSQLYVWDLQTATELGVINVARPASGTLGTYGTASIGRANVGDLDGDGLVEAVFCHNFGLIAVDNNFTTMWSSTSGATTYPFLVTTDGSGATGTTMFDFDANGATEVVYGDETDLRILNGSTGANIDIVPCRSSTGLEFPTVGDVDGNGTTELLKICDIDNNFSTFRGRLTVFQPTNTNWAPSRQVWNQINYFYTNIDDDLQVPTVLQGHHLASGLNSYLNQYADTLAAVADASGVVLNAVCNLATQEIEITLSITNNGERPLSFNMPISVYDRDPTTASPSNPAFLFPVTPSPLQLGNSSAANIAPGQSGQVTFNFPASLWQPNLFIVLNDNGSDANNVANFPYTLQQLPTNIPECDYTNNLIVAHPPTCCFAQNSPDYLQLVPNANGEIILNSGSYTTWPDKVFVPDNSTVLVQGTATLDITNADVVFGQNAGIVLTQDATLLAYNSVFRPCDRIETWAGIRFDNAVQNLSGAIKECTFINAEEALALSEVIDGIISPLPELEIKNNLFTNCYRGLRIEVNGANNTPELQVSGNTFEWGNWEGINYQSWSSNPRFIGIQFDNNSSNTRKFEHPIAQNDFINNTNYGSAEANHLMVGIELRAGGTELTISNNEFSNLDHAVRVLATANENQPVMTIENNFIEVMRRSNRDLRYQIELVRTNLEHTIQAFVSNNRIVNSAVFDRTEVDPYRPFGVSGTGAIYTNNHAHIVDNDILGFEVGIFADGDAIGNFTEAVRIANNKVEAYMYGIYRRGFAEGLHAVINCNTIDMRLMQHEDQGFNSVGICYEISARRGRSNAGAEQVHIENNCVSNTNIAIQLVNNDGSGREEFLPLVPFVRSNFLHNYRNIGLEVVHFEFDGDGLPRIHRNTFFSNNKATGNVLDIVHRVTTAPMRPLAVHNNDFGSTNPIYSVGSTSNILWFHDFNQPATAACADQDGGEESDILGLDCNDEALISLIIQEHGSAPSPNGDFGKTRPSWLPFAATHSYEANPTGSGNQANIGQLQLFPNPAQTSITVQFEDLAEGDKWIKIFNMQGQVVREWQFTGQPFQQHLQVEDLTTGLYELVLMDQRGLAASATFIKK